MSFEPAHHLYQQMICRTRPVARAPAPNPEWRIRGRDCHREAVELLNASLVGIVYLPGGFAVLTPKPGRR